ncbi:AI-2E family transporter [Glaciihabitans sp. dw_435]|uniref:AI-2E family transporter n=1 Tax=Glaciihabitans sp. dw_435 TaxID=2720081 RepID=UPI0027DD1FDB|nr:AI-2E family transporter [Glaciihabitans sp. dw_435]
MNLGRTKRPERSDNAIAIESAVPPGVAVAGAWSWRILAVVGVAVVFGLIIIQLKEIVIPFMIAVLISALLVPIVQFLTRHRWPKALAVAVTLVGAIAIVSGLLVLVITQIRSGFPDLQTQAMAAYENFKDFLANGPLQISDSQFNDYLDQAFAAIQTDSQAVITGALSVGTTAGHFLTGALLVLFSTIFLLIDGKGIWNWIVRLFPRKARPAIDGSGHAGWVTLTTFVKVQVFVAFIDAVGIGLGAWIIGLFYGGFPLVIPIAIAVFLGSFIPVVGAVATGAVAVFVALVFLGPFPAVLVLGVVLLVQQLEGHILQPLVMGSAVKVHPLAVVFAVAAGSFIAGIPGALFAVPVVAVINVMVNFVAKGTWRTTPRPIAKDVVS